MTGVTIDLRANSKTLDEMLEHGIKDTQSFAAQATKEFAAIGDSSEELISKLQIVADNFADLAKSQSKLTPIQLETAANLHKQTIESIELISAVKQETAATAVNIGKTQQYTEVLEEATGATKAAAVTTGSYTAALVENVATLAVGLLTTFKFNLAILALELSYEGARAALENTGKEITVFDSRLIHSRQIINECGGDIDKLEAKLESLGVSADEIGIKLQTNWDKVGESTNKLLDQAFKGGVEKTAEDVQNVFSQMWGKVTGYADRAITKGTKQLTNFIDASRNNVKEWQLSWAKAYGEVTGVNQQALDLVLDFERKWEQAAKNSKVAEINKKLTQEQRDAATKYFTEIQAQEATKVHLEKLTARQTIESGKAKLKALMDERTALADYNMFFGDAAASWQLKYDAVYEAQQRLLEGTKQLRKETGDLVSRKADEKDEDQESRTRENNAYAIMNHNQIKDLIEEEQDAIRELSNSELVGTEEWFRAREQAENRLADLKAHARQAEQREVEEANAKTLQAADFARRLEKQETEHFYENLDTLIDAENSKQLQNLELQGASLATLHKKKLGFLEHEHQTALAHAKSIGADEEQVREISHQFKLRALREEAQFQAKNAQDMAESGRVLQEYAKAKRDEEFEAKRKTEREVHEYRMTSLQQEAEAALKLDNSETEKLRINLQLQKAITDEKKRFADLQKETDVDVKQGGKEPQNMAQQMKELREYRAQQKKNLAESKDKKKNELATKKSNAKAALADKDANRAMANQKKSEELSKKVKEREAKKAVYAAIQTRDKDAALRRKFSKTAGMGAQAQMAAIGIAGNAVGAAGADVVKVMRDAMKGDAQVSLQTKMATSLQRTTTLLDQIRLDLKGVGALK